MSYSFKRRSQDIYTSNSSVAKVRVGEVGIPPPHHTFRVLCHLSHATTQYEVSNSHFSFNVFQFVQVMIKKQILESKLRPPSLSDHTITYLQEIINSL